MENHNPCNVCAAKTHASECMGCALDHHSVGTCNNDRCFCHYECGCLISLDDVCKASTCYVDDVRNHSCSECESHFIDSDGVYRCEHNDGEEIGKWDDACEDFKEYEHTPDSLL